MTYKQLFNAIDLADDKYIKEALDCEPQRGVAVKLERRPPIKLAAWLTGAAACLAAVVIGAGALAKNGVEIPLFNSPGSPFGKKNNYKYVNVDQYIDSQIHMDIGSFINLDYGESSPEFSVSRSGLQLISTDVNFTIDLGAFYEYNEIPVRMFLLSGGRPMDFALGSDDEFAQSHDFVLKQSKATMDTSDGKCKLSFDAISPKFYTDKYTKQISVVAEFFPGYIYDTGATDGNPVSLLKVKTLPNVSGYEISAEPVEVILNEPIYAMSRYLNYGETFRESPTIGTYNGHASLTDVVEWDWEHYSSNDSSYYFYALVDGELYPRSPGEYSYFNEKQGDFRSNFNFSEEDFPDLGMHTIQAIKIPMLTGLLPDSESGGIESGHLTSRYMLDTDSITSYSFGTGGFMNTTKLTVTTDKHVYKKGEKIKIIATLTNTSDRIIKIHVPIQTTICKGDSDPLIDVDTFGKSFVGEASYVTLVPGETYTQEMTFEQYTGYDRASRRAAERGRYEGICMVEVIGTSTNVDIEIISVSFNIVLYDKNQEDEEW